MTEQELKNERWDTLTDLITRHRVRSVIEIGSFMGESAIFFAGLVEQVTCIDPFEVPPENPWSRELAIRGVPNPYYDLFLSNIRAAGVEHKIKVLRGYSQHMANHAPQVDMVFIDGDHSYLGCALDIHDYIYKAAKVLCGDDFHCDENGNPYFPGVHQAVNKLLPGYSSKGLLWWLVK